MRKIIFLLVTLTAFNSFFVFAQDSDTLAGLQRQADLLSRDFFDGKISIDEFESRFTVLSRQMQTMIRQIDQGSPALTMTQASRIIELMEDLKYLEGQRNDKWIGNTEFNTRSSQIKQEIDIIFEPFRGSRTAERQLTEINDLINSRWPGSIVGWPPSKGKDSVGELCGLGPFVQSDGTRASYSFGKHSAFGPVTTYTIYQTGAGDDVFQDLKSQIESASGRSMRFRGDNTYRIDALGSSGNEVYLDLMMYRDVVCLNISRYFN